MATLCRLIAEDLVRRLSDFVDPETSLRCATQAGMIPLKRSRLSTPALLHNFTFVRDHWRSRIATFGQGRRTSCAHCRVHRRQRRPKTSDLRARTDRDVSYSGRHSIMSRLTTQYRASVPAGREDRVLASQRSETRAWRARAHSAHGGLFGAKCIHGATSAAVVLRTARPNTAHWRFRCFPRIGSCGTRYHTTATPGTT